MIYLTKYRKVNQVKNIELKEKMNIKKYLERINYKGELAMKLDVLKKTAKATFVKHTI